MLEKVATEHGLLSKIYRDKQASAPKDLTRHTFDTLRNIEQVGYVQKADRRKFRISHDAFYNLIDMDTELGTFLTLLQFNLLFMAFAYYAELVEKLRSLHSKLFERYFLVVDTTIAIVGSIVGGEHTTRLAYYILLK